MVLGALMELVLACTAIGLFPVLRPYGERIALGHLLFRFFDAVITAVGVVAVLTLLTLSQDFTAARTPDASAYHVAGALLQAVYKWTSMLGPLFFLGINTFMYSALLYKSRLVPRPLAIWGLIGATLVFGYAILVMFGVAVQGVGLLMLLAVPIAIFEMVFAGWLIVKGFNPAAIVSAPATTGRNEVLSPA